MTTLRNTVLAAVGLAMAFGLSSHAHADLLPFKINPGPIGGTNAVFTADALNLSTVAVVTQSLPTVQNETGYAQVGILTLGGNLTPSGGLNGTYGIYITYTTTVNLASFSPGSIGPVTQFDFQMWGDVGNNDTFNNMLNSSGSAVGTVTGTAGDIELATGTLAGGSNTAGFNSNGGPPFSVLATFNLTAAGATVFVDPITAVRSKGE